MLTSRVPGGKEIPLVLVFQRLPVELGRQIYN